MTFPGPVEQASGIRLRVYPLPGHREDAEIIKVTAMRQFIPFGDRARVAGGFGILGTPAVAVMEIARRLVFLPVRERAEATAMYRVVEKGK